VPVSHPDEVEMLAENGAGEFFCRLRPHEWLARYGGPSGSIEEGRWRGTLPNGTTSLSWRSVPTPSGSRARDVHAPYYTPEQQELLLPVIDRSHGSRGRRSSSSPTWDSSLRSERLPQLSVHASSVMATLNSGMIDFLEELGSGG